MEHGIIGKLDKLANSLRFQPRIYNLLHPRIKEWVESENVFKVDNDHYNNLLKKILKNIFKFSNNKYLLGCDISIFNHSKIPNAYVYYSLHDAGLDICMPIIYLIAGKTIYPGDEIFINYSNKLEYGYEDFKEISKNINDEPLIIIPKDDIINKYECIFKQYVYKPECFDVLITQICYFHGLYFYNNCFLYPAERFIKKYGYDSKRFLYDTLINIQNNCNMSFNIITFISKVNTPIVTIEEE
jgi:hypothetical protein